MDFFRNIFGFSNHQPNNPQRFFGFHEEDNSNELHGRQFNVFTDPLEMHRYFEEQMDQMLKTFGFPHFGGFFGHHSAIEGGSSFGEPLEEEPKSPREHFLKKEFVKPHYEHTEEKLDSDLDGKLNLGDLDSIFKGSSDNHTLDVYRESKPFGRTFFNQSVQVKTIRKPDGSLETRKTVRDSEGNEETTINQKIGDKEYTIVKKRDKDGKEEVNEIMVNMDDNDKAIFQKIEEHEPIRSFGSYFDNSLFNKFFK